MDRTDTFIFRAALQGRESIYRDIEIDPTKSLYALAEAIMLFLFDYGDEWLFRVTLRTIGKKSAKARYPRIVATHGEAPAQYPDDDDDPDDQPSFGINPLTGEKICFEK
jgi:hypothetical protein